MFVILVEYALKKVEAVGPFDHQEEAEDYRREHYNTNICRIAKLVPPEKSE